MGEGGSHRGTVGPGPTLTTRIAAARKPDGPLPRPPPTPHRPLGDPSAALIGHAQHFQMVGCLFFFCLRLRFDGHSTRWRWRSVELRLFVPLRSDSAGPAFPSHPSRLACIPLTAISSRLCGWLRERDPVVAEQMPRTGLAVQCQRRRRNHCGFGLRTRPGPGTVLYPFRPAMVPKFCC